MLDARDMSSLDIVLTASADAGGKVSRKSDMSDDDKKQATREMKLAIFSKQYLTSFVEQMLYETTNTTLNYYQLAARLCTEYNLSREIGARATHFVRAAKMKNALTKGKWQVAQLQCRTPSLQLMLYEMLFEKKMFSAASRVLQQYGQKKLESLGRPVQRITKALVQNI